MDAERFTQIEVAFFGLLMLAVSVMTFVIVGRRAGLIIDPKEQAKFASDLNIALDKTKETSAAIKNHEKECVVRDKYWQREMNEIKEKLARIEGKLEK